MTETSLDTQEIFDQLEDIDETWALKLLDECEQDLQENSIISQASDDQVIRVKQSEPSFDIFNTEHSSESSNDAIKVSSDQDDISSETTAIERQMKLKADQAKSEPSNTGKVGQGFWSFLKKSKAVN
jgi:hypothetical protein